MAGSYNHAVDHDGDGQLYRNEDFTKMVENLGDAYETVEEMYGMIWWLASQRIPEHLTSLEVVEWARLNYMEGLRLSPGTDGELAGDE